MEMNEKVKLIETITNKPSLSSVGQPEESSGTCSPSEIFEYLRIATCKYMVPLSSVYGSYCRLYMSLYQG